ncbi:hypothetical protein BDFB_015272 [Asbolus verrucosus]|uniref:Uncharacterized protein n=1 Tax=Asbolus verrucosus TaxID=1661398 RepID=A0A482VAN8_ASBVE|nr:hypothetical protein BDFB_015272 [Asbolus verrucosus]
MLNILVKKHFRIYEIVSKKQHR